jgi:hypothetical protein
VPTAGLARSRRAPSIACTRSIGIGTWIDDHNPQRGS